MTNRQIKNELEEIYKERKSWNGGKGPFTKPAIRQRETVLIKQHLLYRIEDAKLLGDIEEEKIYAKFYELLKEETHDGKTGFFKGTP